MFGKWREKIDWLILKISKKYENRKKYSSSTFWIKRPKDNNNDLKKPNTEKSKVCTSSSKESLGGNHLAYI